MDAVINTTPLNLLPHFPRSSPMISRRNFSLLFSSFSSKPLLKAATAKGIFHVVRSEAAMEMEEEKAVTDERIHVMVPPHPLIKHWSSVLRNEQTPSAIFKNALAELGRLLIYEASRDWLPTITGEVQSPKGVASVEFVNSREPVLVIPIIRAGLALAEFAPSVLPATKTYHLGMQRDETTLRPSTYLNNLPDKFPKGARLFVVDPVLATGGTMVAAIELLKDRGVYNKQIKIISVIAGPPALEKLSKKFPGLHVYTTMIDPIVNEKGFILPGLGDAGDRSFGGTMVAAIELLKDRGVYNKQIKIISVIAGPPALEKLSNKFPGLHVYTMMIDPIVNEKGFILPGLGDAGDRSFGT